MGLKILEKNSTVTFGFVAEAIAVAMLFRATGFIFMYFCNASDVCLIAEDPRLPVYVDRGFVFNMAFGGVVAPFLETLILYIPIKMFASRAKSNGWLLAIVLSLPLSGIHLFTVNWQSFVVSWPFFAASVYYWLQMLKMTNSSSSGFAFAFLIHAINNLSLFYLLGEME